MSAATLRHIMRDSSTPIHNRGVAQPGSAPPWGGGGRRFKSSRPDQHHVFSPAILPHDGRSGCARVFYRGSRTAGEVLWTRTIHGPRPSGRLRRSKSDPVEFVFARAKKRDEKKARPDRSPRIRRAVPSAPPEAGRSPNSPGAGKRASGSIKRLATTPGFDAVLGSRHGVFNPPQNMAWSFCVPLATFKKTCMLRVELGSSHPVWRARASQTVPEYSRAPWSSPRRVVCVRRVGARAGAGEKRREDVAPSGGVFSLVTFFARAKKVTLGAGRSIPQLAFHCARSAHKTSSVGQPPTSMRRRRRHKISGCNQRNTLTLHSRSRGNDEK